MARSETLSAARMKAYMAQHQPLTSSSEEEKSGGSSDEGESTGSSSLTAEAREMERKEEEEMRQKVRQIQATQQCYRSRGRPTKADKEEREKDREANVAKLFEEKGELFSLVLVDINNKLAVQNGLWSSLKKS